MAHQPLPGVPSRDFVFPSGSPASAMKTLAEGGLADELLPHWTKLPTRGSDFQSLVNQVVELARILTGATGCAVALREGQVTVCCATSGEGAPPIGARVDSTSAISKQCLDSGTSLYCDDIRNDGRIDPHISRVLRVRAVAVVPILRDGEIAGILEVFSGTPGIFRDQHLTKLQQLANLVGNVASTLGGAPSCNPDAEDQLNSELDIKLLVELEPAPRAFFRNLSDLLLRRSSSSLDSSSSSEHEWSDVFVASHIPWRRFVESVFLHVLVISALSGLSRMWPRGPILFAPRIREADVTYYPFRESFPARGSSPLPYRSRRHAAANPKRANAGRPTPTTSGNAPTSAQVSGPPMQPPETSRITNHLRSAELGSTLALPPPPEFERAFGHKTEIPSSSIVAPPPELRDGPRVHGINVPTAAVVPPAPEAAKDVVRKGLFGADGLAAGSVGTADISIVPPAPSTNNAVLTYGSTGAISKTGVQIVAPPPAVQGLTGAGAGTRATLPGPGAPGVVPPPPSLERAGSSVGQWRGNSVALGGSQVVVPPSPSMQGTGAYRAGIRSVASGDSQVIPPPPSLRSTSGGNSVGGRRGNSLPGSGSDIVLAPSLGSGGGESVAGGRGKSTSSATTDVGLGSGSGAGAGKSEPGVSSAANTIDIPSAPRVEDNRMRPMFQDVQLRVIGLALALPSSSYFSNYEVFVAEKWLSKKESQLIKLVYVFLPYQRRLSEYGFDNSRIYKLRVTRDPTCDESLLQMTWPEGEKDATHSATTPEPQEPDRKQLLPCYRTTADDYRRAVSHRR